MNFLKIALSNKLKNNDFNSWQTTNLNNNPQASELAAIVLAEGDQNSLKAAQDLQKTSGLGIPIIKVSHETISNNEKEKVTMFCTNPSAGRCVVPDIGGLRCEAVFRHACIGYRLRGKRRPAGKGHECQACR